MGRRPINGPASIYLILNIAACRNSPSAPHRPASHGLTPSASLARRPLERVIVAALVLLSACRLCPSRSQLQFRATESLRTHVRHHHESTMCATRTDLAGSPTPFRPGRHQVCVRVALRKKIYI